MAKFGSEQQVHANRISARGVLFTLLAVVMVFSFAWYLLVPRTGFARVEPDKTEAVPLTTANPVYILLVGSDSLRGTALFSGVPNSPTQAPGQADIITLVRIDPSTHTMTLLSIPRDTYCINSDKKLLTRFDEKKPGVLVSEVEKLTGVEIDYFFYVTFAAFENIIDEIGGIVVDVPAPVAVLDPAIGKEVRLTQGNAQLLNGSQALALACAIDESDELGEARRQTNVRNIEQAMIDRVITGGEDSARRAITALRENATTNIDPTMLISLAIDYVVHSAEYRFYSGSAPYEGTKQEKGQWGIVPDRDQWRALMSIVDSGQNPNYVVQPAQPIVVKEPAEASASSSAAASSAKETNEAQGDKASSKKNSKSEKASSKDTSKTSSKDSSQAGSQDKESSQGKS